MAQIEATLDIRQGDNLPSLPTKTSSQTQSAAEKYRLAEEIVFSQLAQKLVNVEQSYLYSGKGRDLGFDGIGFDGDGGLPRSR